jgi:hypothetical protein
LFPPDVLALEWLSPNNLFPGFRLPLTECRYFVPIAAGRDAAPLTSMILCRVVEIEHARGGVGAPMEIAQVRLSQEEGDLASENGESQLFSVKLRD